VTDNCVIYSSNVCCGHIWIIIRPVWPVVVECIQVYTGGSVPAVSHTLYTRGYISRQLATPDGVARVACKAPTTPEDGNHLPKHVGVKCGTHE
jgi:hypothetical protein